MDWLISLALYGAGLLTGYGFSLNFGQKASTPPPATRKAAETARPIEKLPPRFQYIGHVTSTITRTNKMANTKSLFEVPITLFMAPSGERRFIINALDKDVITFVREQTTQYNQCLAWGNGGGFPDEFVPESDVLIGMLSKLVDKKLVGDAVAAESER